jgi:hypothetical protein
MIVGGIILLLLGWFLGIHLLLWAGVLILIVGACLMIAGSAGHAVGGRKHYY